MRLTTFLDNFFAELIWFDRQHSNQKKEVKTTVEKQFDAVVECWLAENTKALPRKNIADVDRAYLYEFHASLSASLGLLNSQQLFALAVTDVRYFQTIFMSEALRRKLSVAALQRLFAYYGVDAGFLNRALFDDQAIKEILVNDQLTDILRQSVLFIKIMMLENNAESWLEQVLQDPMLFCGVVSLLRQPSASNSHARWIAIKLSTVLLSVLIKSEAFIVKLLEQQPLTESISSVLQTLATNAFMNSSLVAIKYYESLKNKLSVRALCDWALANQEVDISIAADSEVLKKIFSDAERAWQMMSAKAGSIYGWYRSWQPQDKATLQNIVAIFESMDIKEDDIYDQIIIAWFSNDLHIRNFPLQQIEQGLKQLDQADNDLLLMLWIFGFMELLHQDNQLKFIMRHRWLFMTEENIRTNVYATSFCHLAIFIHAVEVKQNLNELFRQLREEPKAWEYALNSDKLTFIIEKFTQKIHIEKLRLSASAAKMNVEFLMKNSPQDIFMPVSIMAACYVATVTAIECGLDNQTILTMNQKLLDILDKFQDRSLEDLSEIGSIKASANLLMNKLLVSADKQFFDTELPFYIGNNSARNLFQLGMLLFCADKNELAIESADYDQLAMRYLSALSLTDQANFKPLLNSKVNDKSSVKSMISRKSCLRAPGASSNQKQVQFAELNNNVADLN